MASHLAATYEAVREHILRSAVVYVDETWWRLMDETRSKTWWVWGPSCRNAVYHRILGTRASDSPRELLKGYRGVVVADGYPAYQSLARAGPGWTLANCWAHYLESVVIFRPSWREETFPGLMAVRAVTNSR